MIQKPTPPKVSSKGTLGGVFIEQVSILIRSIFLNSLKKTKIPEQQSEANHEDSPYRRVFVELSEKRQGLWNDDDNNSPYKKHPAENRDQYGPVAHPMIMVMDQDHADDHADVSGKKRKGRGFTKIFGNIIEIDLADDDTDAAGNINYSDDSCHENREFHDYPQNI